MVSYRDGVSIGELIIYIPVLVVAVLLAIKHGFGRNSGWLFLVVFSLTRIIGACFQLATIHDPTNTDLYTGAAILQSTGLSPLMLAALGLLSRVITSIAKVRPPFPNRKQLLLVELIVALALILGILGGTDASDKLKSTGKYVPQTKSKIAVVLFIIAYNLIFLSVLLTFRNLSHAEQGEKRILVAIGLSLPFIFVRLLYSCLSTFDTHTTKFNQVSGNVTIWLFMALVMELIVVIIFEGMGLTLQKLETYVRPDAVASPQQQPAYGSSGQPELQQPYYGNAPPPAQGPAPYGSGAPQKGSNILETLGRRTIIGRIVTAATGNRGDVEMQRQQQQQTPYEWK